MTEDVLVPIDGSPLSRSALRYALTAHTDASITVLHVIDLFEPGYGAYPDVDVSYEPLMGSERWYEQAEEVSQRLLDDARDLAADQDRDISTVSEIGDPDRVVVEYVDDEGVDHVILGAHGRPDPERPLFGSVAETVARRSPVPVTIIR